MTSEDEKMMFVPGSSVHDTVFPRKKRCSLKQCGKTGKGVMRSPAVAGGKRNVCGFIAQMR